MAFSVVMTEIDDFPGVFRLKVDRNEVAIGNLLKGELIVPNTVVVVFHVEEHYFDPILPFSLQVQQGVE